ncbi:hypothetical protein K503DRAFT_807149 [Rhizopogon vinicolor AM-OR11-026]|uniref:Uncharacterized protein n=1 Tax=Rhizopogon vinicolor AM-OR11-026 TaxID=1314800 RepID=A0A1B7MD40_9AGAM|nr:hypothetical protein K503DRAFT_807149 [Rhizopogon vinicolor AM-OR11-026]
MLLMRGISSWNEPYTPLGPEIATTPVLLGDVFYEAEELNFFNYAVNVFLRLPMLPRPTLQEPIAMYTDEFSKDRKLDIYNRAPDFFEGPPPPLEAVLNNLKFGKVDDPAGSVASDGK